MAIEKCTFCQYHGFICEKPLISGESRARLIINIPSRKQAITLETIEACTIRSKILQGVQVV